MRHLGRVLVVVIAVSGVCVIGVPPGQEGTRDRIAVTVHDDVLTVLGDDFCGLHYDGPMHRSWDDVTREVSQMPGAFASPYCRDQLRSAGVCFARVFVNQPDVHPRPGEFDWATTDRQVAEIHEAGMSVMLCLHQRGGAWFVGDNQAPWWGTEAGRNAWREFARVCARRYRGRARYYEILNEPNHLHKDQPHYMGWDMSVALFMDAAKEIVAVAPDVLVGGPATWAAWEATTWAKRVLSRPDGERLLSFVSYHIYTSHDLGDSDAQILAKSPWFEEAPMHIRRELSELTERPIRLALTEYNVSAVSAKDGKPFTDPRNVNTFGGLLTALALLHSARGACDMTAHFGTMGGFGVIRWPPEYQLRRPYHAVRLLYEAAGLRPGVQVLRVETTESPKPVKSCVRGDWPTRDVEAFALRRDGDTSVVLVNKSPKQAVAVAVRIPGIDEVRFYRYTSSRLHDAIHPLGSIEDSEGAFETTCPPYSLTVLRTGR
jgi:hypothetical protein